MLHKPTAKSTERRAHLLYPIIGVSGSVGLFQVGCGRCSLAFPLALPLAVCLVCPAYRGKAGCENDAFEYMVEPQQCILTKEAPE